MSKHRCTLFVKDVDIEARVGIFDVEKQRKTRLSISLEVECKRKAGRGTKETIADLISYGDMVAMIKDTVNKKHFDLIETLADEILDAVENFPFSMSKTTVLPTPARSAN